MTIKTLYSSTFAPNPMRVNHMLKLKGVDYEFIDINILQGEQMTPEFKAINPDGTVPIMILDDGTKMCDTIGILHYLDQTYPEKKLMGSSTIEQANILSMMHRIFVNGFLAVAEGVRNGLVPGFEGRALPGPVPVEQIPELVTRGKKRLITFYQTMETLLEGQTFLIGEDVSQADIDLFVCCNFAGMIKQSFDTDSYKNLAKHFQKMETLINT